MATGTIDSRVLVAARALRPDLDEDQNRLPKKSQGWAGLCFVNSGSGLERFDPRSPNMRPGPYRGRKTGASLESLLESAPLATLPVDSWHNY